MPFFLYHNQKFLVFDAVLKAQIGGFLRRLSFSSIDAFLWLNINEIRINFFV